jgi:hypothetical protein
MAGIDLHNLNLWSRNRIVVRALPLDRFAQCDQENAPIRIGVFSCRFPASFNLVAWRQYIDQIKRATGMLA